MTEKEIETLAREYVADVYDGDTDFQPEAECMLKWLSERYEIVEKEKIREEYAEIETKLHREDNPIGFYDRYNAQLDLLESLFPQTLKTEER